MNPAKYRNFLVSGVKRDRKGHVIGLPAYIKCKGNTDEQFSLYITMPNASGDMRNVLEVHGVIRDGERKIQIIDLTKNTDTQPFLEAWINTDDVFPTVITVDEEAEEIVRGLDI